MTHPSQKWPTAAEIQRMPHAAKLALRRRIALSQLTVDDAAHPDVKEWGPARVEDAHRRWIAGERTDYTERGHREWERRSEHANHLNGEPGKRSVMRSSAEVIRHVQALAEVMPADLIAVRSGCDLGTIRRYLNGRNSTGEAPKKIRAVTAARILSVQVPDAVSRAS